MEYVKCKSPAEFYEKTIDTWMEREAENNLPIGIMTIGAKGGAEDGWRNTSGWVMAAVKNQKGEIIAASLMTPPFNILIYESDKAKNSLGLNFLCESLVNDGICLPGVTGRKDSASRFAQKYAGLKGARFYVHRSLRAYILEALSGNNNLTGSLRPAQKSDMSFLPYWHKAFNEECGLSEASLADGAANAERALNDNTGYILTDEGGVPVSMASFIRKTENLWTVSNVYTPPYFRNKGYAAVCVAMASKMALDMGKRCVLFADLKNPVSNHVYQKIGYMPVCDYDEISFTKEQNNG